jgi:pilus assembly protein CpaB
LKLTNRTILIVAVVLAAAAAFFVYWFISGGGAGSGKAVPVLVAAQDIPVNTAIAKEMLAVKNIPEGFAHPSALHSPEEAVGKISKTPLLKAEQILTSKVASKEQPNRFSYHIPEKQRAITLAVTEVTGVAGFPTVGDRVDILLASEKTGVLTVSALFQNKEILATGGVIQPQEDGQQRVVPTLTLSLTPAETMQLVIAEDTGRFRLTLRSPADKEIIAVAPVSYQK